MDRKAVILVVEGDAMARSSACEHLATSGYDVRTAASAREGLSALLHAGDVDVVLLDLVMPEMDGFEFLRCHSEAHGRAAVVVFSGCRSRSSPRRSIACSAASSKAAQRRWHRRAPPAT